MLVEHTSGSTDDRVLAGVADPDSPLVRDALEWLKKPDLPSTSGTVSHAETHQSVADYLNANMSRPHDAHTPVAQDPLQQQNEHPESTKLSTDHPPGIQRASSAGALPQAELAGPSIAHEIDNGVIRFLPTADQWSDFPNLLECARDLGAENVGACKVLLPEGTVGLLRPVSNTVRPTHHYSARRQSNGNFLSTETKEIALLHVPIFPRDTG